MSFRSKTYRVLIASPSDLLEERQAATDAVDDWNAQHAVAESVILLPVKWDTHALPQTGVRPQEAINNQLVRDCYILVGLFWTRLGTSTGIAESGTVEEIDMFVASGKPALLYFSGRPIDPNKIDLKQHKKLRRFKDATYKRALTGGFNSVEGLRQTLLRDLVTQVRELNGRRSSRHAAKPDRLPEAVEPTAAFQKGRAEPLRVTPVPEHQKKGLRIPWDPSDPSGPGPLIEVVVMNSRDVLEAWRDVGIECPQPVKMKALLDTGAAVTVISKTFAKHCKLLQTGESEVRVLGAQHKCGEHAGTITFAGSDLLPAEAISIRSVDFIREPYFACLIGRNILRNWTVTFDGPSKRVTIVD